MEEQREHVLDATERVLVSEFDKTVQCPRCETRIEMDKNPRYEACHICSATFVDEEWEKRADEEWLEAKTKPKETPND